MCCVNSARKSNAGSSWKFRFVPLARPGSGSGKGRQAAFLRPVDHLPRRRHLDQPRQAEGAAGDVLRHRSRPARSPAASSATGPREAAMRPAAHVLDRRRVTVVVAAVGTANRSRWPITWIMVQMNWALGSGRMIQIVRRQGW